MKTLINIVMIFVLTCNISHAGWPYSFGRTSVSGNSVRFYGKTGNYLGRAQKTTNGARYYNSKGVYSGRAITRGNVTRYYGPRGAYQGSAR